MNNLLRYYNHVVKWNKKCNVQDHHYDTVEFWRAVQLQTNLLVEEATEAQDAAKAYDPVELLDGAIDQLVILSKFIDMLDQSGFDVEGAMQKVLDNNDEKVFNSYYEAVEAKEKLELRDDVEYWIDTSVVDGIPYYSIKDMNGKVRKHVNFKAVDLGEYVP